MILTVSCVYYWSKLGMTLEERLCIKIVAFEVGLRLRLTVA